MDITALIAAIFGAVFGASVAYQVVKRQWWKAIGSFALDSAALLNIVTLGNRSYLERRVVLAATMILFACFVIADVAAARARRRTG